jgi:hypothetical protein
MLIYVRARIKFIGFSSGERCMVFTVAPYLDLVFW